MKKYLTQLTSNIQRRIKNIKRNTVSGK